MQQGSNIHFVLCIIHVGEWDAVGRGETLGAADISSYDTNCGNNCVCYMANLRVDLNDLINKCIDYLCNELDRDSTWNHNYYVYT